MVVLTVVKCRFSFGFVQRDAQCAFSLGDEFGFDHGVYVLHLEFDVLVGFEGQIQHHFLDCLEVQFEVVPQDLKVVDALHFARNDLMVVLNELECLLQIIDCLFEFIHLFG